MLMISLDKHHKIVRVFADLSKVFDLVNQEILLEKLDRYGIRSVAHRWMSSYLNNRKHYIEIIGKKSDNLATNKGVPQGSVLGPLLYIIYVNDFPIKRTPMYVADTSFIVSVTTNKKVDTKASQ